MSSLFRFRYPSLVGGIVCVGLAIWLVTRPALPARKPVAGGLRVLVPIHDFGAVGQMEMHSATFRVVNDGSETIRVTEVTRTCSCATAEFSHYELSPGQEGELRVQWRTGSKRGPVRERVSVIAIDETKGRHVIDAVVTALVQSEVECDTERVTMTEGKPLRVTVPVRPGKRSDVQVLDVRLNSPMSGVEVRVENDAVVVSYDGRAVVSTDRRRTLTIVTTATLVPEISLPVEIEPQGSESLTGRPSDPVKPVPRPQF